MESNPLRTILSVLAFIVVIIFIIVMFARLTGNRGPEPLPAPSLSEVASSDAQFTFTESGPIVAEENHHQIRIRISRMSRTVEVVRGYQNLVVASQTLPNTEAAFSEFLSALDRAGYGGQRNTRFATEEGICPNGRRFVFVSDQFNEDFRRWTTSCQEKGSFAGSLNVVRQLYTSQIPEYNQFISGTRRETGLNL